MSSGIAICSVCKREVHSELGDYPAWWHCTDLSPLCSGGKVVYPESLDEVVEGWCGKDADVFILGLP